MLLSKKDHQYLNRVTVRLVFLARLRKVLRRKTTPRHLQFRPPLTGPVRVPRHDHQRQSICFVHPAPADAHLHNAVPERRNGVVSADPVTVRRSVEELRRTLGVEVREQPVTQPDDAGRQQKDAILEAISAEVRICGCSSMNRFISSGVGRMAPVLVLAPRCHMTARLTTAARVEVLSSPWSFRASL